jgi:quinol-cytochrome oxidoreductase complex cytochrome b subunit
MTAHAHDQSTQEASAATGSTRPRWLVPAVVGGIVVGALVVLGVLSASVVLYGGLMGGMLLMHVGGHGGHGAHAGPGGKTHQGQGSGTTPDAGDLSHGSRSSQPEQAGSSIRLDDRAKNDPKTSETDDHP